MAQVSVCILGGTLKVVEGQTVGAVKRKVNASRHTATVNGDPKTDAHRLKKGDFISLAPSVKGG